MRIVFLTLLAAVTLSVANASTVPKDSRILAATEGLETVEPQLASLNGIRAGEQVLAAVNHALGDAKKVDRDQVHAIFKRVAANDVTLKSADIYTQEVVAAIRTSLGQLFPGEEISRSLIRVLPSTSHPAPSRRLIRVLPSTSHPAPSRRLIRVLPSTSHPAPSRRLIRVLPSTSHPAPSRRLQSSLETVDSKDISQGSTFNADEANKIVEDVDGDDLLA